MSMIPAPSIPATNADTWHSRDEDHASAPSGYSLAKIR
jgi:hypothetical protein